MKFSPMTDTIGADVEDCDLNDLIHDKFSDIRDALWKHLVLRFRGQKFGDEAQLNLNARFGNLDFTPERLIRGEIRISDSPYMEVVSNILEDGRAIGALGNHELVWHSDMSFLKWPYGVSILRSVELPPSGGDTSFANMFHALDYMPTSPRREVEGRSTIQDGFLDTKSGEWRGTLTDNNQFVEGQYDGTPAIHPIVRTHPETQRQYVYLGRRPRSSVAGLQEADNKTLLDDLWTHATRPGFTWTQKWQVGDVILWDNRCTMHHRTEFDVNTRRILRRTASRGEVPY